MCPVCALPSPLIFTPGSPNPRLPAAQAMATRQQGVFRKYARPEVLAADWDEFLLRVSGQPGVAHQQPGMGMQLLRPPAL